MMATSRNPAELLDAWRGWHAISRPMRPDFVRYVELANKGARELGFADNGAMWRSKYDMPPDDFAKELDRLWDQVRPLYLSLHAYVRTKLREKYGDVVPANGPIPAHLLGNMWAQTWDNIYPLVAPRDADPGYDLTEILKKPQDRLQADGEVRRAFLHVAGIRAAAADVLGAFAVREAARPRRGLPRQRLGYRFRGRRAPEDVHRHHGGRFPHHPPRVGPQLLSARLRQAAVPVPRQRQRRLPRGDRRHHRALGDARITWSRSACSTKRPDASKDIGLLLHKALEKIAFLPFGLVIDQWRWKVFSGEIPPDKYNQAWWELRLKYQGIAPPVARSEDDFDPGAKYHVAANTPYMRYFLADILQFQFHRALARIAGCQEPLNRCSIYGNKEAGAALERDAGNGSEPAMAGGAGEAHRRVARWMPPPFAIISRRCRSGSTSRTRVNRWAGKLDRLGESRS